MKNKKVFFRLSIYFFVSEILVSLLLIAGGYHYVRDKVFEKYRYQRQYELHEVVDRIHSVMDKSALLAATIADDCSKKYPSVPLDSAITNVFKSNPYLYALRVVTQDNANQERILADKIWYSSGQNHKSSPFAVDHKDENANTSINQDESEFKPHWGAPFYFSPDQVRLRTYAFPLTIKHNHHLLHTTVYCVISLNPLLRQLKSNHGYTILLDNKNQFIYHPNPLMTGKEFRCINLSGKIFNSFKIGESGFIAVKSNCLINKKSMVLYFPIESYKWFIISTIPIKFFSSKLNELLLLFILFAIVFTSISIVFMIFFSNKLVVSPVSELAKDSQRIAEEAGLMPNYHLTDLEALSEGIYKMKDSLVNLRQNSLQNSIDKELLNKELHQAHEIEMGMVPTKYPLFDGRHDLDCYGKLLPAKIVGGDLFDIFLLDDNVVFMLICDTMGKGIPAAMFAVMVRTYIRSITNPVTRLGKIMESINDELFIGKEIDMFATIFMSKLDLINGRLTYCNAGHPKPLILRRDGELEHLELSHGFPIGIRGKQKFNESMIHLNPGDSLVAYTDGVTDHYNSKGDFFGESRLISTVSPLYNHSSEEIVNRIFGTLSDFQDSIKDHDDTTVVVLKYLGKGAQPSQQENYVI